MWYASSSTGAHWIPSTVVPGVVLEAGASVGPCSRGIPSGPTAALEPALDEAVEARLAVIVGLLLPPHAASRRATITAGAAGNSGGFMSENGCEQAGPVASATGP